MFRGGRFPSDRLRAYRFASAKAWLLNQHVIAKRYPAAYPALLRATAAAHRKAGSFSDDAATRKQHMEASQLQLEKLKGPKNADEAFAAKRKL